MRMSDKVWIYRRLDGLFEWRRVSRNGRIVATSGGQGYARESRCKEMAVKINPGVVVERWPG